MAGASYSLSQPSLTSYLLVCYSGAQQGSFLFIHASDAALMAKRWLWPLIPRSLSSLVVDVATNPLQPISTGQTSVLQPRCFASAISQVFLLICLLHRILPGYIELDDVNLL